MAGKVIASSDLRAGNRRVGDMARGCRGLCTPCVRWTCCGFVAQRVDCHGDHLNLVIALNQDTLNQHTAEVNPNGGILYNSDKLQVAKDDLQAGAVLYPFPIKDLTERYGR